jgi:hypothetical protein
MIIKKHFIKILSATLLTLFTTLAFAQNNPILSYKYHHDLSPIDSTYYTYNTQGYLTEKHTVTYNLSTKKWENSSREVFMLNTNGKATTELLFKWENSMWVQDFRKTNTFTNNQLVASLAEDFKNNNWNKLLEQEYRYRKDGKVDTIYYSIFNNGTKRLRAREKYNYNFNGNIEEKLQENLREPSSWTAAERITYSYTPNGNLIRTEKSISLAGSWTNFDNFNYTYDNNDLLRIKEHTSGSNNQPVSKEVYLYKGETNFLSVKDVDNALNTQVYPNPSSDKINFKWENEGIYSITITDVLGKQAYKTTVQDNVISINISTLKQGIYFYQTENLVNHQKSTGKFIVSH